MASQHEVESDDVPTVNGIRYKPKSCATEAFSHAFDAPFADDPIVRERLDAFVTAMPAWVVRDTLAACALLTERVRALRSGDQHLPGAVRADRRDHIHISWGGEPMGIRDLTVKDLAAIGAHELPPHLRDDAPKQQCTACRRFTVATSDFGGDCRMPQPSGDLCPGRFTEV